jgi:GH24 family phage-related lysozyme (muramidase)
MFISQEGIDLIKKFEGCRLTAYDDGTGVYTIGYGHTAGVKKGQVITQRQAENYLIADLTYCACDVKKLIDNNTILFKVNQTMFDALVSFTFNLGAWNLIKLVANRTVSEVANAMLLYVNAGGKRLQGLVNRRNAERELFLRHEYKFYTIKPGDTLRKISKNLGVSQTYLIEQNNIVNPNIIFAGDTLRY